MTLDIFSHCIYPGHNLRVRKGNQRAEVTSRIARTGAVFGKIKHILRNTEVHNPIDLKQNVYN